MSRYEATSRDANRECMVGWDPPLATFFAQVYDHTVPDPFGDTGLCVWVGASYGEITTVADLVARIAVWADVDHELAQDLERDQLEAPAWPRRLDLEAFIASLDLPHHFDAQGRRIDLSDHFDAEGRRIGLDCPDVP